MCGRQPAIVTAREQPTAAPSSAASSSIGAKPSAEPAPRPPETTTLASASETPPVDAPDPLHDAEGEVAASESVGVNVSTLGGSPAPGSAATA